MSSDNTHYDSNYKSSTMQAERSLQPYFKIVINKQEILRRDFSIKVQLPYLLQLPLEILEEMIQIQEIQVKMVRQTIITNNAYN